MEEDEEEEKEDEEENDDDEDDEKDDEDGGGGGGGQGGLRRRSGKEVGEGGPRRWSKKEVREGPGAFWRMVPASSRTHLSVDGRTVADVQLVSLLSPVITSSATRRTRVWHRSALVRIGSIEPSCSGASSTPPPSWMESSPIPQR